MCDIFEEKAFWEGMKKKPWKEPDSKVNHFWVTADHMIINHYSMLKGCSVQYK